MESISLHPKGFTLIELSIVLVIIGLIVGGVLTGRDLVKAAEVQATITQMDTFNQAANVFYGKYGYLPGDIKDPDATNFGFLPRGQYAGQGDGDGILTGINGNGPGANSGLYGKGGETVMFWSDLTYANGQNLNLIKGNFSTATTNTAVGASGSAVQTYFPAAKLGAGNYFYVYSDAGSINYFGLSVVLSNVITSNPGLTVKQAYDIDRKIDDGLAHSGRVLARYDNTLIAWTASAATDSSSTCFSWANNFQYSIAVADGSNLNCALSFKMQAGD